jgi:methylmalonyl-CoA mutase
VFNILFIMRPDFSKINFKEFAPSQSVVNAEANWIPAEQIPVKPVYTAADLNGMEHLNYAAGVAPFLRGPYSTMYVNKPWTVRQYAGFSTAAESNAFYRKVFRLHST